MKLKRYLFIEGFQDSYNDKIIEYGQELYETINDYIYDIQNCVTDLRRKATDTSTR